MVCRRSTAQYVCAGSRSRRDPVGKQDEDTEVPLAIYCGCRQNGFQADCASW